MMFFNNIPDIFHFGDLFRQGYESRYERKIGKDARNTVLLEPLEISLARLNDIRNRIDIKISKEMSLGADLSKASSSLREADVAIEMARKTVAVATSTIEGPRPRTPYSESQAAYIALDQARRSLNSVLDMVELSLEQASSSDLQPNHGKTTQ